jgi:DNA-binding NarL/FixJ family response regulator
LGIVLEDRTADEGYVRTRVYVCDDSPEHRALMRAVLADEPELEVVGEAGEGGACLSGVRDTGADVLVLDLRMPGMDGWEALERLRGHEDAPRVLVMSSSPAHEVEDRVRAAGADFLRKGASPEQVREAVRRVGGGS